jgi:hypothetical protein
MPALPGREIHLNPVSHRIAKSPHRVVERFFEAFSNYIAGPQTGQVLLPISKNDSRQIAIKHISQLDLTLYQS